jgi:1-acyl-sn-glycerol-3-phosphate acyltransferase
VSRLLLAVRSSLATVAVLLWILVVGSLLLYPLVVPAAWLLPARRHWLISRYMKFICRGIFFLLRLGGTRAERVGRVDTTQPVLILMNHQSLLDIVTATLMAAPNVPAFVTRIRYAHGIPVISTSIRLLGCPVIDPKRDPRGALGLLRDQAPAQDKGLLIFPEGHRSLDGAVRPFKTAGAQVILAAKPMPVALLVTDGFWTSRRLIDFVFDCGSLRGRTEVLGPFPCPERSEELVPFLEEMRARMVGHLEGMRKAREGVAA